MTTMEKAATNPRRSLVDLSAEHLRAIVAGDVAGAQACEGAARPWSLYPCELHIGEDGATGVMLSQPCTIGGQALPALGGSQDGADRRFVPMEARAALELCGQDRVTPEAIQRVIDALDRAAEWSQLAAVFEWLAHRRTETVQGLDDIRAEEIAALPAGSFAYWKPYAAHRFGNDDSFRRYLGTVERANAEWLAERQQEAREAGDHADADQAEHDALRESVREELYAEIRQELHRDNSAYSVRAEIRAELRADEDLRGEIREELMALVDPEPGAFEAMDQWLTVQIDRAEREAKLQAVWPKLEQCHRRAGMLRVVRDMLRRDKPLRSAGVPAAAPAPGATDQTPAASPAKVDTEDTGRMVDAVRNIGYILSDLDEIAGDRRRTALDVLRMADEDEPHDARATGLDDQLLSWCRRLVGRWSD